MSQHSSKNRGIPIPDEIKAHLPALVNQCVEIAGDRAELSRRIGKKITSQVLGYVINEEWHWLSFNRCLTIQNACEEFLEYCKKSVAMKNVVFRIDDRFIQDIKTCVDILNLAERRLRLHDILVNLKSRSYEC
jgi:hypothetical protein